MHEPNAIEVKTGAAFGGPAGPRVNAGAIRVVKVGGAAIDAGESAGPLWSALADLHRALVIGGGGLVLVHGGGAAVDRHLARLGVEPRRRDGLRITGAEEIDEVVATIGGLVNARVVARLSAAGGPVCGLGLSDGGTVALECPDPGGLGRVGHPSGDGDPRFLHWLLAGGWMPAVACVGRNSDGFLNVNADAAAAAVASVLGAAEFVLLTDVAGVRGGAGGAGDVLPELDAATITRLETDGVIAGGMVPKVRAALASADASGRPVRIASWTDPASITGGGTIVRPTQAAGAGAAAAGGGS